MPATQQHRYQSQKRERDDDQIADDQLTPEHIRGAHQWPLMYSMGQATTTTVLAYRPCSPPE